jgi:hypothetical protein
VTVARTVSFTKPHRVPKLYDELRAAIPAVRAPTDGSSDMSALIVAGDGVTVAVTVAETIPLDAVAAVVAAHDAATPGPSEAAQTARTANESAARADLAGLLVKIEAGTITAAEQRRALARIVRLLLGALD